MKNELLTAHFLYAILVLGSSSGETLTLKRRNKMNRRKNRVDHAIDKMESLQYLYFAAWGIVLVGAIRLVLYAFGMKLTQCWVDAPLRWLVHFMGF